MPGAVSSTASNWPDSSWKLWRISENRSSVHGCVGQCNRDQCAGAWEEHLTLGDAGTDRDEHLRAASLAERVSGSTPLMAGDRHG